MLGILYSCTNKLNNKIYIGKTYNTLEERWNRHIKDAFKRDDTGYTYKRKFYYAIRKYGIESFEVKELGRFESGLLEEKEKEYIRIYDTFRNGYNSTIGGDGVSTMDTEEENLIVNAYVDGYSIAKIGQVLNRSQKLITKILTQHEIEIANCNNRIHDKVPIILIDDSSKKTISFISMSEAYKFMLSNGNSVHKGDFYHYARKAALNGTKAFGYRWAYSNNDIQFKEMKTRKIRIEKDEIDRIQVTVHNKKIEVNHNGYANRQMPNGINTIYPPTKEQLEQLYPRYTVNSMAKQFGISYNAMNNWLKRYDIK